MRRAPSVCNLFYENKLWIPVIPIAHFFYLFLEFGNKSPISLDVLC